MPTLRNVMVKKINIFCLFLNFRESTCVKRIEMFIDNKDWFLKYLFVAGHTIAFEKGFDETSGQIGKFAFAFYNGLFSYDGWWVESYW